MECRRIRHSIRDRQSASRVGLAGLTLPRRGRSETSRRIVTSSPVPVVVVMARRQRDRRERRLRNSPRPRKQPPRRPIIKTPFDMVNVDPDGLGGPMCQGQRLA